MEVVLKVLWKIWRFSKLILEHNITEVYSRLYYLREKKRALDVKINSNMSVKISQPTQGTLL